VRVDELRARQHEVLAALARPLTGASRARAALPAGAADDPAIAALAAALIAPSATLDPAARLEIYRRQCWLRLLGALADDFPALRWLLGPAVFAALAERYLSRTRRRAPRGWPSSAPGCRRSSRRRRQPRSTRTSWPGSRPRGRARSPRATARRWPRPTSRRRRWRWRRT
jgi:hypothetical protein